MRFRVVGRIWIETTTDVHQTIPGNACRICNLPPRQEDDRVSEPVDTPGESNHGTANA
jgi:hypothetical protein